MISSVAYSKKKIRKVITGSKIPEDPYHAENTLQWLFKLFPKANEALQVAALGHDIDRANETTKAKRTSFKSYDAFKEAHAKHSAEILRQILKECKVPQHISQEVYQLVTCHEVGGSLLSNILKDADSISYFDVNLPLYYHREGWEKTKTRSIWGYKKISKNMRKHLENISYKDEKLNCLVKEIIQEFSENENY